MQVRMPTQQMDEEATGLGIGPSTGTARRSTRTDGLYERLRHAIVSGELRPNQRLVELELAERLKVSRTPVRETLQRLALDRLVTSYRRGWIVREHTRSEIREIYECRSALESYATRLAAEKANPEQIAELELVLKRGIEDPRPPKEWMVAVNDAFHDGLINAADNEMLAELCIRSRLYYFNNRIAELYRVEEAMESREQHLGLLDAVRRHEPDEAERLARAHVATALRVLFDKLS
jgi:DNA-binding GntR family transcriptional regulator